MEDPRLDPIAVTMHGSKPTLPKHQIYATLILNLKTSRNILNQMATNHPNPTSVLPLMILNTQKEGWPLSAELRLLTMDPIVRQREFCLAGGHDPLPVMTLPFPSVASDRHPLCRIKEDELISSIRSHLQIPFSPPCICLWLAAMAIVIHCGGCQISEKLTRLLLTHHEFYKMQAPIST